MFILFQKRERNKVLARQSRVKKKAEFEKLRSEINHLTTENILLKNTIGPLSSFPKPLSSSVLLSSDFGLPDNVIEIVEKLAYKTTKNDSSNNSQNKVSHSSLSFCITNPTAPDNPIVYASPAFVAMTGYDMHMLLGHNWRFLYGIDTDKDKVNYFIR